MRKFSTYLLFGLAFTSSFAFAQKGNVGIGTTKPDLSAVLELNSTNKGLLIPRMSLQQRDAIQTPAQGLMIFQTDLNSGFYFFSGKDWKPLVLSNESKSIAASDPNWTILGNSGTTPGTNFIGTTDAQDLVFKVNNQTSGLLSFGSGNTFYGYQSGKGASGGNNVAVGINTLGAAGAGTTSSFNVALGSNALKSSTSGGDNMALGNNSLQANTSGSSNMAVGSEALRSNILGVSNVAIGVNSLYKNNGDYNVGVGTQSLYNNIGGSNNMALGLSALFSSVASNNNTAIGNYSLYLNTGGYNTAIGAEALYSNTVNPFNIGIGPQAAYNNTGSNNVAIGFQSLNTKTTGDNNVAIGHQAGFGVAAGGSSNLFIGYQAGFSETGSNKLYLSNSNTANPLIKGDFAANNLQINSKTTGYLAIGDFTTSPSGTAGTGGLPLPSNIGVSNGYRLVVQDGILCEKVKVALRSNAVGSDWADYVFEPEYKAKMMSLEEVEKFTLENKHLPNVLSTQQMVEEGLDVAKTSKMFMEKIEELTLYLIEMNKEIKALKAENEVLKNRK